MMKARTKRCWMMKMKMMNHHHCDDDEVKSNPSFYKSLGIPFTYTVQVRSLVCVSCAQRGRGRKEGENLDRATVHQLVFLFA